MNYNQPERNKEIRNRLQAKSEKEKAHSFIEKCIENDLRKKMLSWEKALKSDKRKRQ